MKDKTEHWMKLCQQAAVEEDPCKLLALITEINNLVEAKEDRLKETARRRSVIQNRSKGYLVGVNSWSRQTQARVTYPIGLIRDKRG